MKPASGRFGLIPRADRSDSSERSDPALDNILEELTERIQIGDPIKMDNYVDRYPEFAEQIRRLVPALAVLAELGHTAVRDILRVARANFGNRSRPRPRIGGFGRLSDHSRGRPRRNGRCLRGRTSITRPNGGMKVMPFAAALDPPSSSGSQPKKEPRRPCTTPTSFLFSPSAANGRPLLRHAVHQRLGPWPKCCARPAAAVGHGSAVPGNRRPQGNPAQSWHCVASVRSGPAAEGRRVERGIAHTTKTRSWFVERDAFIGENDRFLDADIGVLPQGGRAGPPGRRRTRVTRTGRKSCTGTSSRPTCWSTSTATSGSPISAWPGSGRGGRDDDRRSAGTLRYMSPEQVRGRPSTGDDRTDIYSLGATLYELLTLRSAIEGTDRHELLRVIEDREPIPPRRHNPASRVSWKRSSSRRCPRTQMAAIRPRRSWPTTCVDSWTTSPSTRGDPRCWTGHPSGAAKPCGRRRVVCGDGRGHPDSVRRARLDQDR